MAQQSAELADELLLTPTAERTLMATPMGEFLPPPPVFLDGMADMGESTTDGAGPAVEEELYMNSDAAVALVTAEHVKQTQQRSFSDAKRVAAARKKSAKGRPPVPTYDDVDLYAAPESVSNNGYPSGGGALDGLYAAPEGTQMRHETRSNGMEPTESNRESRLFGSELEEFDSEDSWDQDMTLTPCDGLAAAVEEARQPQSKFSRSSSLQAKSIVRRIKAAVEQKADETAKATPAIIIDDELYGVPEAIEGQAASRVQQAADDDLYGVPEAIEGQTISRVQQESADDLYMTPEAVEHRRGPTILPSGWVQAWDTAHKRHYYFNSTTKETCWEIPQ
jgi:hypothetical protein